MPYQKLAQSPKLNMNKSNLLQSMVHFHVERAKSLIFKNNKSPSESVIIVNGFLRLVSKLTKHHLS